MILAQMRILTPSFLIVTTLFASTPLLARDQGAGSSGGGAAVVCRDSDGKIFGTPLLYDLYEAENDSVHRLRMITSQAPVSEQVADALIRLKSWDGFAQTSLRRALGIVERDWSAMDAGTALPYKPDVVPQFLPKDRHCKLETLAHYYDSVNALRVDMEIYNLLPRTHQAALKFHEALYKLNRVFSGHKNSQATRKFVARLFSIEQKPVEIQKGIWNLDSAPVAPHALRVSMPRFDLVLGAKTLYCEDRQRPGRSFTIKMVKGTEESSSLAGGLAEDELGLEFESSANPYFLWSSAKIGVSLKRLKLPREQWGEDFVVLSAPSLGSDSAAVTVRFMNLLKDEVFTSGEFFDDSTYDYWPERGPGVQNLPLRCKII